MNSNLSVKPCYTFIPVTESDVTVDNLATTTGGSAVLFKGKQIKNLYKVPTIVNSPSKRKVKIAIIVAYHYPALLSDLNVYWNNPAIGYNFGADLVYDNITEDFIEKPPIPPKPPSVIVHNLAGTSSTSDISWAVEECLDLQCVCALNPYAEIHVVESTDSSISNILTAIQYAVTTIKADIISMSFGIEDYGTFNIDKINNYFINTNTCFCASTGDYYSANWPSTSPNVIAVGGTSLYATNVSSVTPTYLYETPWNTNLSEGGGCGYSLSFSKPYYQKNLTPLTNTYNRTIPDVSLVGDFTTGTYVYCSAKNGWLGLGGTSLSCPIFASILSTAIQQRINDNKTVLTSVYSRNSGIIKEPINSSSIPYNNIQNYLYKSLYTSNYNNIFNDIPSGSNTIGTGTDGTNITFYTGVGYDIPSGLGSVNATNLSNILNLTGI
jgi:subtilase family serine protease